MVGISYRQKPQRRTIVELFGGEIHESPSALTRTGRDAMKRDPDRIGSLAVATGEAIELAREMKDSARFAVGSGETCVLLHQTVIGNEAVGRWRRSATSPTTSSPAWAPAATSPGSACPSSARPSDARKNAAGRRRAGRLPETHPRRLPLRHQRFLRHHAGDADVHAREPLSRAAGSMPAGSAITAPRRSLTRSMPGIFSARAIAARRAQAGAFFADCEGIIPAPESAHAIAAAMEIAAEHKSSAGPAS